MSKLDVSILDKTGEMFPEFDGFLFITIIDTEGIVLDYKEVHPEAGVASFDLSPGAYTVVVQHPSTNPQEVKHPIELASETSYIEAKFYFDSNGRFLTSV